MIYLQTQYGATIFSPRNNTMTVISNERGHSGRLLQDVFFEEYVGPIPFGYYIGFADNDPFHLDLSNLLIIKKDCHGQAFRGSDWQDVYNVVTTSDNGHYTYDYSRRGQPFRLEAAQLMDLRNNCSSMGLLWVSVNSVHYVSDYSRIMNSI